MFEWSRQTNINYLQCKHIDDFFSKFFMYKVPVAWSKLPVLTKSCKTIQTFNYHVKRYFINAYSSSMDAYRVIISSSRYWYYYSIVFIYVCLYSQVYAGAIVMFIHVQLCDITIYGLYHLTDIVYLWYNPNLCRIVFRIL